MLFRSKKTPQKQIPEGMEPILLVSICTGETTAGFRDKRTGKTVGVALIQNDNDLQQFRSEYGITGDIQKVY